MTSSREAILAKIRSSLRRGGLNSEQVQPLKARSEDKAAYIRPAFQQTLLERFVSQLEGVAGSFEKVSDIPNAFTALAAHLERLQLPQTVVAAPDLSDWKWPTTFDVRFGGTQGDDLVAVTGCFAAVAETGSVVCLSGPNSPTGLNFLPDYHVAMVRADQLLAHVEDVWPRLRALPQLPRTVNFISGPSKTADVEQTLQIGAHGPRSFHVILIES